jgi:hypothetical protein
LVSIKMSNFLSSSIIVRFAGKNLPHGVMCLFVLVGLGFLFLNSAYETSGI